MTSWIADDLPDGWEIVRLGDRFESWGGLTPSKANPDYWGDGLPWVSSGEVKGDRVAATTYSITQKALDETGLRICPAGSVLVVTRSGILAHSLPVAIADIPLTINQDVKAFCSTEPFLNEWLALYLRSNEAALLQDSRREGTTVQSIQYSLLKDTLIPVPPVMQRQQIIGAVVRALDLQASVTVRVVSGRRAIERLRQAVVAAACSGHLTADWRTHHPDSVANLPKVANPTRRESSEAPVDLELPDLPETYTLTTVGAVARLLEYGTSRKADADVSGVPVLRMGNIQGGRLDTADLKYCASDHEIERLMLQDGDLLFNRTNSPELVGKSAVFHERAPMTFASYLIRVRFAPGVADADFVNYWINSAWGRMWARYVKTDGVSQSNINGSKLGAMPLPLPPFAEQQEIVRRAEALLDRADRLTTAINAAIRRVDRTSQAVLAKAFRGELLLSATSPSGRPIT